MLQLKNYLTPYDYLIMIFVLQKPHDAEREPSLLPDREQQEHREYVDHARRDLQGREGRGRLLVHGVRFAGDVWGTLADVVDMTEMVTVDWCCFR